ncbi:MAG: EAL domain-containing protein [Ilumatobacteraceae bacterium]
MARVETDDSAGEPMAGLILAAFHASPDGVVIQRPSGAIVAANDAAQRLLGLAGEDLRERTSLDPRWQAVRPDGRPFPGEMHPAMVALRSRQAVRDVVMGVETPDGQRRWLRVDSVPIVTEGVLRGVASFFVDATAQRGAEGALVRAEDRLRVATEAGRLGLFEWDPTREMIWCDEAVAGIVGCAELPMSGSLETLLAVVHPQDRDRADREMRTALTSLAPSEGTYRVVRPDGSVRSIIVQAGVASTGGDSPRLTGAIVDVTELYAAHERVVELLESMTDAYFTLDVQYRFTYVNPTAERLLGRDRGVLLGRGIWDEFVEAAGSEFERQYRTTMTTGRPVEFESFYPPHGRSYEVRAHVVPGGLAVYFRDVSDRRAAEAGRERLLRGERAARKAAEQARAELAHLAAHDVLTGLPNRLSLATWLTDRLSNLRPGRVLAVCYVDLDRFKLVNDSWGHSEGDRLLVDAARRIRAALRPEDFLARLGGDEFVVVVEGTSQGILLDVAERFAATLRDPFDLSGRQVVVTASVGIAFAGRDTDAEVLVRDADAALYRAKEAGRDRIVVFDDAIRGAVLARIEIEADLRTALTQGAVVPHYQPAFSLATGQVVGVEALARWNHPVRGDVPPCEFIPVAEETGLITELGTSILRRAVTDASAVATATANPDVVLWVNVSQRQLCDREFVDTVLGLIDDRGVSGPSLGIEIVETALLDDIPEVKWTLDRLAESGLRVAIDDFGTGHSSLARLHRYPIDLLKIDQSFVTRLDDPAVRHIVAAITNLAHAIGASTCAEGVRSPLQLDVLRELGVASAGGYYLARPVALNDLTAVTRSGLARAQLPGRTGRARR